MTALSAAFGPFAGRIWLNCAHQGPLPLPAAVMHMPLPALWTVPVPVGTGPAGAGRSGHTVIWPLFTADFGHIPDW